MSQIRELLDAVWAAKVSLTEAKKRIHAIEAELNALRAAAAPFVEAFNDTHAHSYRDADEEFTIFLDRNTITPSVKVGDFRRLAIAAKEPK